MDGQNVIPAAPNRECRACARLGRSIAEQAEEKRSALAELFSAAGYSGFEFLPSFIPNSVTPSRYRAKFSVGGSREAPLIGFSRADGSVVDHTACPLHHPQIVEAAELCRGLIERYKLDPYEVGTGKGELKGLAVRLNSSATNGILRFVLRSTEAITRLKKALPEIQAAMPALRVISCNIQPLPAAIPEGPEEQILTEEKAIEERYCGRSFMVGPQTFSQVTPETAEALYQFVAGEVGRLRSRSLLDLYCGVGVFSVISAPKIERGLGVELSVNSIACAMESAELNGRINLQFEAADVEKYLALVESGEFDTVIANPPRRGCGPAVMKRIAELAPKQVIFSSCNPETLVADIGLLGGGYRVALLAPFEMFPLTEHLEAVAVLERR